MYIEVPQVYQVCHHAVSAGERFARAAYTPKDEDTRSTHRPLAPLNSIVSRSRYEFFSGYIKLKHLLDLKVFVSYKVRPLFALHAVRIQTARANITKTAFVALA
jgi:hypothetical protein